jgi:hypothetical protein
MTATVTVITQKPTIEVRDPRGDQSQRTFARVLMVPLFARHPAGQDTADLRGEAAEAAQELMS